MKIKYECIGVTMLTNCPNGIQHEERKYGEKFEKSPIKVNSIACSNCQHFDGYHGSKQVVFCKYED